MSKEPDRSNESCKNNRKFDIKENQKDQGSNFQCDFCGKSFSRKANLKSHRESKHEFKIDSKAKRVQCDLCNKTFKSKDNLKRHNETVHLNIRKFHTCELCEKTFLQMKNLNVHYRSVHNDSSDLQKDLSTSMLQCKNCDTLFASRIALNRHVANMHKEIFFFEV